MSILFKNPRRELISLTDDRTFHYAFSRDTEDSKRALIAILNVILDKKDDPIESVSILNPVIYGEHENSKDSVLDIKAITNSQELIDIEMQGNIFKAYPERSLFYGGRLVNSALEKGQNYDKLKKSIVISIVDGILFKDVDKVHTAFKLKEVSSDTIMSDKLEFHFLELGKINDAFLTKQMTDVDKLATYFKYAGDKEHEEYLINLLNEGNEAVIMTEYIFRELTEDEIAYEMEERRIKYEHDLATFRYYAREEGLAEGRAEGIEQGLAEGRKEGRKEGHKEGRKEGIKEGYNEAQRETASKMKKLGLDFDTICQCTGLTKEEVELI